MYKYCYETNKWFEPSQTEANVYWVHLDNDEECQSMNTRWNLDKWFVCNPTISCVAILFVTE